jgi:hypothetical protein
MFKYLSNFNFRFFQRRSSLHGLTCHFNVPKWQFISINQIVRCNLNGTEFNFTFWPAASLFHSNKIVPYWRKLSIKIPIKNCILFNNSILDELLILLLNIVQAPSDQWNSPREGKTVYSTLAIRCASGMARPCALCSR